MVEIRNMGAYAVKLTRRYWLVKLARSVNRVHDGVLNTYYVLRSTSVYAIVAAASPP